MVLQRWDPVFELRRMHRDMDRFWRGIPHTVNGRGTAGWSIPLDAVEEGDKLVVRASMPGINADEIDVTVEEGVLRIKGETKVDEERKEGNYLVRERRSGSFHRSLQLPDTVDLDKAETTHEDGVLTITFPKSESKKAKHLTISKGKALAAEKK